MKACETALAERPADGVAPVVMNRPAARNAENLQFAHDPNAALGAAAAGAAAINRALALRQLRHAHNQLQFGSLVNLAGVPASVRDKAKV